MKLKIDQNIIKMFPDVKIGLLVGKNVNNKILSEDIASIIRQHEQNICKEFILENVSLIPKILDWREAYRLFGCKPSEYRSSVEALVRRILQGKQLPLINNIVDLYNFISIKYILPVGGGDLDKIEGDIILKTALGTEQFVMLGSTDSVTIKSGEVIYIDNKDVLCRAWNYREADKTKITENSSNIYLLIEGLSNTTNEEIINALNELKSLVSLYCKGEFKEFLLNKNNLEISF